MIIMPGQSVTVRVPLKADGEGSFSGEWRMEEVPPPREAPVQNEAEQLGLCRGLRAEKSRFGQWRCSCCHKMQREGDWQVWVPDSVMRGDPEWSVTEAARQNAWNGHLSAWCLKCAPKGSPATKQDRAALALPPQPSDPTNYFPLAFAVALGAFAIMAMIATGVISPHAH